jgi:hypothetical protein
MHVGMRMSFMGMRKTEHGNRNGLCGEGGIGMAEHGMSAYPLLP